MIEPVALGCQALSGGGSERQCVEMAKALDRSRFAPHVIHFREDPVVERELREAGVEVRRFPVRSFAPQALAGPAWSLWRYLRERRIRLYHSFDLPAAVVGLPVARMARVPVVLSSVRGHRSLYSRTYLRLVRWSDRFAHGFVVNSLSLRDHLVREEGADAARVDVCANGFHSKQFAYEQRMARDAVRIGCVCALREEKDLGTLIRAVAALRSPARLRIVGSGAMEEPWKRLAADLSLPAEFLPATREVAAALRDIDIFVLPSLNEGLSNSLMEAMASGCCVVASDVGGNPELVEHGVSGMLFAAGSVESLRAVLERLLADPALRQRLAEEGSRRMHAQYSMAASARSMELIYQRYLAASRSGR